MPLFSPALDLVDFTGRLRAFDTIRSGT